MIIWNSAEEDNSQISLSLLSKVTNDLANESDSFSSGEVVLGGMYSKH